MLRGFFKAETSSPRTARRDNEGVIGLRKRSAQRAKEEYGSEDIEVRLRVAQISADRANKCQV